MANMLSTAPVNTNTNQPTTVKPMVAKPPVPSIAPTQASIALPAKKIEPENKTAEQQKSKMSLGKPNIGVVEPPKDMFQYSMNKELKEKEGQKKEAMNAAMPLASSSLGDGSGRKSNFFRNLLLLAGAVTGGYFLIKKMKLSSVSSSGITNLTDIKAHLDDLINTTKKGILKPFHLKKATVRVIDESVDNTKEVLKAIRNIATEARNVDSKTPKILLKLKENSDDAYKVIKEALSKGHIDSLSDDVIKNIEYINLEYLPSEQKSTDIIIETMTSRFMTNRLVDSIVNSKIGRFFKDLFM